MENEIKNSVDFINKKASKKTGFSVPSDYFNEIEPKIEIKIIEENLTKSTAFRVPDAYFDNLENSLLQKTTSIEKPTKVITLKKRILKLIPYAAVASIALFIALNTSIFKADELLTFETISDTEIEYWLNNNGLNTNEIAILLEDEILDENTFSFTSIEDDSIEEYMNSIDNTFLLDELD